MKKAYLRALKLTLSLTLSTISVKEFSEYYDYVTKKPVMNISIAKEEFTEEFSIKPYNFEMILEFKRDKLIEELTTLVEKYASIYCINSESVLKIISFYTNNFNSNNFLNNKNIYNTEEKYLDFSSQILYLVRDIYINPKDYIEFNIEYCYDVDPMVNDMTIREFVYETADIIGLDRNMALAIPCFESGYFKYMANYDSYGTGGTYNNIYHGIISGMCNVKENFVDRGYTTYTQMASGYCPPNKDVWAIRVQYVENKLKEGFKLYDEEEKELVYSR